MTKDELKKQAIAIRDEKTENANTAQRVGTALLNIINDAVEIQDVSPTASVLDAPVKQIVKDGVKVAPETNSDAVKMKGLDVPMSKTITEINVSELFPTGGIGGTNKFTLAEAIKLIPAAYRTVGIKCTFVDDGGSVQIYVYQGGTFTSADSWLQSTGGGNKILEWKGDKYTTRKQVKEKQRKAGIQISYKSPSEGWINEQYISDDISDASWVNNKNWDRLTNEQYVTEKIESLDEKNSALVFGGIVDKHFNDGEVGLGYIPLESNTPTGGVSFLHSFIKIDCAEKVAINTTDASCILAFYDTNKIYLSKIKNWSTFNSTLDVPNGAVYICISINANDASKHIVISPIYDGLTNKLSQQKMEVRTMLNGGIKVADVEDCEFRYGEYHDYDGIFKKQPSASCVMIPCRGASSFSFNNVGRLNVVVNQVDSNRKLISNIAKWSDQSLSDIPLSYNVEYLYVSATQSVKETLGQINITFKGAYGYADNIKDELDKEIIAVNENFYREIVFQNTFTAKAEVNLIKDFTELVKDGEEFSYKVDANRESTELQLFLRGEWQDYIFKNTTHKLGTWYKKRFNKDFKHLALWCGDASGSNTLNAVVTIKVKANFNQMVAKLDIVDSCNSEAKDKPLSAHQGMIIDAYNKHFDASYMFDRTANTSFFKCLFIDCGRKYISPLYIKKFIDAMAEKGMNMLQLHLWENTGFRFALDDMNFNVNGQVLDLSKALGFDNNGGLFPVDGANKWITQSQMDEIINYANSKGIEVVPSLDMPGHFNAISNKFPNAGNPLKYELIRRYGAYFASRGSRFYNIGGDETGMDIQKYMAFMGDALRIIAHLNMTPIMWNDEICKNGYLDPYIPPGVVVMPWTYKDGEKSSSYVDRCGYRQINCDEKKMYCTFMDSNSAKSFPKKIELLKQHGIGQFGDGGSVPHLFGAAMCIWNDGADLFGDDEGKGVYDNSLEFLKAFGDECIKYENKHNAVKYAETLEKRIAVLESKTI